MGLNVVPGPGHPDGPQPPETPQEFEATVHAAQESLTRSVAGWMRREPYAAVLTGLSDALGVLPGLVRNVELASHPFSQEERNALARGVIATVQTAVHSAARKELAAHVHTLNRAHVTWLACMIGGGIILGVTGTLGTLAWTQTGPYAPEAQDAAALAEVARNNPGIAGVLAKVMPQLDKASGKRFGVVSVWLQPAPSAPATVAAAR